jgi:protein-tyrosine-phosphatase
MQLVFVCSGNTCRSPLALAAWHLAAREIDKNNGASAKMEHIEATSAGLCATAGAPAARYSRVVAREWGVDLSQHRAGLFMPQHAKADLIITMTEDQAAVLRSHFNIGEEQVRLLGSYAPRRARVAETARFAPLWGDDPISGFNSPLGEQSDILDPYGGSLEAYQACAAQIRRCTFELARVLAGGR